MKRLFLWYLGLFCFFFSVTGNAGKVDDIRVVIDVSGSMVKTDPQNLRAPALRMLNGMIPSGAKAGVWTFGRYVNMEVKWGTVNQQWRERADQGAAKIHSRGQFTNIERALERSTTGWNKPDPNTERSLILLTDGKVDISKDPEKNRLSRSNVIDKSIPKLIRNGIKVHAIALSDQTDETLLKRLALKTSGSFEIAESADDLQRIFLHMFERATKPDTVPLHDNKFTIDKSIREMTLLVFRNGNKKTRVFQPDKVVHSETKHGQNVRWRNDQGYDLITVSNPQSGVWRLDADVDPDNRVMIVTDLKLMVDDLPSYHTPDKPLAIKVELHNKNKKISKNSFLKFVEFKLEHKHDEQIQDLPLNLKKSRDINDKGIYLQQIDAPLSEGKHEVIVHADARTFNRSKRYSIDVQWPVIVNIDKTTKPGIYRLSMEARKESIKAESLRMTAKLKQPDGKITDMALSVENDQWKGEVNATEQDGLHQLLIEMQAQSVESEPVSHQLSAYSVLGVKTEEVAQVNKQPTSEQESSEQPVSETSDQDMEKLDEEKSSNLVNTIIIVAVANVILILLAVGAYFFIRKRGQTSQVDLLEENPDKDKEEA